MLKKLKYYLIYLTTINYLIMISSQQFEGEKVDRARLEVSLNDNRDNSREENNAVDNIESGMIRRKRCEDSKTFVNGKKIKCRGEVIFLEEFDQKVVGDSRDNDYASEDNYKLLNSSLWRRDVRIPSTPNYEFCVYHKLGKNLKISDGTMKIIPTLLDNEFGEDIVYFGNLQLADCTGVFEDCSRKAIAWNILPPIISARLTTKETFNFRYGKIEIKAKFPRGDWLYPELLLHGIDKSAYTIVNMGMARGNRDLYKNDDPLQNFNAAQIEYELLTKSLNEIYSESSSHSKNSVRLNEDFHVYTTIWNEDGFIFEIDNVKMAEKKRERSNGSDPFHEDFYLTIGLGVGGVKVFPDNTTSGSYGKPWKNRGAKAMLRFWQAKDHWLPTWHLGARETSALEIDYVKIISV